MKTIVLDVPDVVQPAAARAADRLVRTTFVVDEHAVYVPAWVQDHASFRRWFHSDEFPEGTGRICYLDGEVWVDMSREQIFTHNQVKGEYNRSLGNLVKTGRLGRFFPDGVLISNVEARLSVGPDGAFASSESLRVGRIRLVEGKKKGYVELEGTPDMVLEVLSESSVRKDKAILQDLYWRAGIREYWLVDARGEPLEFDILRHTAKGYVPTRKKAGWVKSAVFGKSFQLVQQVDELGHPECTLAVR